MANQLHIYYGNPTTGNTDGTEASSGTQLSPISVVLDATKEEMKAVKCAVRCDAGYHIEGNTTLNFIGTNADKWMLAPDDNYEDAETALASAEWESSLALANVNAKNTIFWVQAESSADETPSNDTSVSLQAEGLVVVDA